MRELVRRPRSLVSVGLDGVLGAGRHCCQDLERFVTGGNVAPAGMAALSRPWRGAGDTEALRETYLRLLPLLHFTYSAINPVPVKSLMKALGLPAGDLRRPLRALEGGALASGHAGDERRDPDRA